MGEFLATLAIVVVGGSIGGAAGFFAAYTAIWFFTERTKGRPLREFLRP